MYSKKQKRLEELQLIIAYGEKDEENQLFYACVHLKAQTGSV